MLMPSHRYPQLFDHEWLAANAGRKSSEIALEIGCVPSLIAIAYRRAGIPRSTVRYSAPYAALRDPDFLAGRTVAEVMAATGASDRHVRAAFGRAGITPKRPERPTKWPELTDRSWLEHRRRWALGLIADDLGCSETRVALAFKQHGINRDGKSGGLVGGPQPSQRPSICCTTPCE